MSKIDEVRSDMVKAMKAGEKETKETLSMLLAALKNDRPEIIEECNRRLQVLEQYAPKLMDEGEIRDVIAATLSELGIDAPTAKDKGRIMKVLMPKVKGKADGKLVSETLGSLFQ